MKVDFHSSSLKIFSNQKDYIEEKIPKLARHFEKIDDPSSSIRVQVEKASSKKSKRENFICTVTFYMPGGVLRASHAGDTVEASFDLVFDALKNQIKKKKVKFDRFHEPISEFSFENMEDEEIKTDTDKPRVTKRKRFSNAKPITEGEAIRLMEISNHDFWLFLNAKTERFSVIYKRGKRGEYGVIEPKVARDI